VNRAHYDIQHKNHSDFRWKLATDASDGKGIERDVDVQNRLLSILYVKRRQNVSDPDIGNLELERLLGCPAEHLEFHIWSGGNITGLSVQSRELAAKRKHLLLLLTDSPSANRHSIVRLRPSM